VEGLWANINYLIIIISGANVIRSLPRPDNGVRVSEFGYVLLEVRTPVRTASGMGNWRGMVIVTIDTDYYYCYIIKLFQFPTVQESQT